jgi:hypothetical protein
MVEDDSLRCPICRVTPLAQKARLFPEFSYICESCGLAQGIADLNYVLLKFRLCGKQVDTVDISPVVARMFRLRESRPAMPFEEVERVAIDDELYLTANVRRSKR